MASDHFLCSDRDNGNSTPTRLSSQQKQFGFFDTYLLVNNSFHTIAFECSVQDHKDQFSMANSFSSCLYHNI